MAQLIVKLDKCVNPNGINCPYAGSASTPGAGCAEDYYCKLMPDPKSVHGFKITSGYVEWLSEIHPIPLWCPIMSVEDKMLKKLES
jgi:hypothetical protein